jgi:hypothetical protein
MDGWMDGWMDGRTDMSDIDERQSGKRTDRQTDRIKVKRNGTALIPPFMQKLNFLKIKILINIRMIKAFWKNLRDIYITRNQ